MSDPAGITEQSTVTISLLVGAVGLLVVATRAFVTLSNKVDAVRENMMPRHEVVAAFLRLARDNPDMKVPDLEEQKT